MFDSSLKLFPNDVNETLLSLISPQPGNIMAPNLAETPFTEQ